MPDNLSHIKDHFLRPRNVGGLGEAADAFGEACSPACGAVVCLSLQIDAKAQRITRANFKATGCQYLIAAASITTELLTNMTLDEATALSIEPTDAHFADFPKEKKRCAALCYEALYESIARYRRATAHEEWSGEEALICICFGVSEKTIEGVIRADNLHTVGAVTAKCNAGGGCGSCRPLIEDIIEDYWRVGSASLTTEEEFQ